MIDGYQYISTRRQSPPSLQETIECEEKKVDAKGVAPSGLCAVLTTLVLAFCLRYQMHDPWIVAKAIGNHFSGLKNKPREEMFRINITHWYRHVYTEKRWIGIEKLVGLLEPPYKKNRRCLVYLRDEKKPCTNRACDNHAYCPLHRYSLLVKAWGVREWDESPSNCTRAIPWDLYNGQLPNRKKTIKTYIEK